MEQTERLRKVSTTFTQYTYNATFQEPYNQVMFQNKDTVNSVWINKVEVKTGQQLNIALNEMEVNTTKFEFDFKASATALLVIIYTQYLGIHE